MTARLERPGVDTGLANHERRVRALERQIAGGKRVLEALWWGITPPAVIGPWGGVWTVPYVAGVSVPFTLVKGYFRLESASVAGSYTVVVEKSPPGGVFVPTTVTTLTLAVGAFSVTTSFSVVVNSGDLLRINWTAIGSSAGVFTVQAEGTA